MSRIRRPKELASERQEHAAAIGERIRRVRIERGMTQSAVAGDRFSKAYISAIETGHAFPSMPSLQFIADQLGVPPELFVSSESDGDVVAMPARIRGARFADGRVYAELLDGRAIGMPMERSRKLMAARQEQLTGWSITDAGRTIAWSEIGEEIGLEDFFGMRILAPREVENSAEVDRAHRRSPTRQPARRGSYDALTAWLSSQSESELLLAFEDVERALGRALPPSARRYSGPWHAITNPLGRAIERAGWKASVDLAAQHVTLTRR